MILSTLSLAYIIQSSSEPKMDVKVDPGMEVIAITMWLGGKYGAPTDSPYKLEVWNHFRKFKNHPAIIAMRTAQAMYTDFTENGVFLTGWPKPQFHFPSDTKWRKIMGPEYFDSYTKSLPDFIEKSNFLGFFQRHKAEYARYSREFLELAKKRQIVARMEDFYKYGSSRARPSFEVFLEPLNSWGAHAIVLASNANTGLVQYQLGYWSGEKTDLDQPISFQNADTMADVAWHEGSHVYVRQAFDKYRPEFAKTERLFNKSMLTNQGITTWEYCLNENVVRAITAVLIKLARGDNAFNRELDSQVKRSGFIYTRVIAELIASDYVGNAKYANFDDFFPEILKKLETLPDYKGA